jgi:hypothetical protein
MVRRLVLLCGLASLLSAADPREIVRKAVELDERNSQLADHYTFLQREEVRDLDHSGKVKNQRTETWDVMLVEGSPYKRLVARDGQPLSAAEQRVEDEKLRQSAEERRRETSEQRDRRLSEWRRKQERQHQPLRELPDAFDFTLLGEEDCNGRPAYHIEAVPKPGYKPQSSLTAFFPKVRIRAWIDKSDLQASRIELEATDTISFGGLLLRLEKGSQIVIEQARLDSELWLPRRVIVVAEGRVLLLKNLNREMEYSFSDYKKFQADSRVVFLQPVAR